MEQYIRDEVACRTSMDQAAFRINQREYSRPLDEDMGEDGEEGLLRDADTPRNSCRRPDDDPFVNDSISRDIQVFSPCPDDSRLSAESTRFMISLLVLMFNVHWWGHTGSCFKSSQVSSCSGVCRYGYPRNRVSQTRIGSKGIELVRRLGHEYVNAYNTVLMAIFKRNHDIQVPLGGKDVALRIYYACKYATKVQNFIDSIAALALASFIHRLAREEQLSQVWGCDQSAVDIGRKRLTSLISSTTGKQEIAGPLAVLYIMHGSCCFESDSTVRLPLPICCHSLMVTRRYRARSSWTRAEVNVLSLVTVKPLKP